MLVRWQRMLHISTDVLSLTSAPDNSSFMTILDLSRKNYVLYESKSVLDISHRPQQVY